MALSVLAYLFCFVMKDCCPPFPVPRLPAIILLWARLHVCHYFVRTWGNFSGYWAFFESFCSDTTSSNSLTSISQCCHWFLFILQRQHKVFILSCNACYEVPSVSAPSYCEEEIGWKILLYSLLFKSVTVALTENRQWIIVLARI